jgi:acylphosphatase
MVKMKSSGNGQKCYNIMVTGKVQDIGFRALIENAGRLFDLSGLVFNARDGSVRIVCCGEESIIGEFFQEVRSRGVQRGATIQDIGNDFLGELTRSSSEILKNTSALPDMKD